MAQRHVLRGACRILTDCQSSLRSSALTKSSNNGLSLRSIVGKVNGSASPQSLAACPVFRSFRAGQGQVSAFPSSSVPMGFAASALSTAGPLSVLGSVAQQRSMSSLDSSEEGDGEDADPTYLRPVADSQSSLIPPSDEDEPPDLRAPRRSRESFGAEASRRGPSAGPGARGGGRGGDDAPTDASAMEALITARDIFIRQPDSPGGPLPALPREVREAMYGHRWDRILVDVRRSVVRKTKGKEEVYTAMVATGNLAGVLGLGIGTAETAQLAVARAHLDSFTRLTAVPLYRGHTIYHSIDHEYHRTKIRLMPRPEGWGVRASDFIYELCSLVGIRNISIKLIRHSKNKFFIAQCFQEALLKQTTPHDGVEATGMYIREVYYKKELPYGLKRGVDIP